jgi:predicted lysophospholipase L1 biosynthesis ABC-type transport system permease subunit
MEREMADWLVLGIALGMVLTLIFEHIIIPLIARAVPDRRRYPRY